jgi:Maltokinase N-terminal cap domain
MALLHDATVSPSKDELVGPWLRTRPWWDGQTVRSPVGSFRLDDPDGAVGMECFLLGSAAGSALFVPVTYRDAPLQNREANLLGTMEHSVLGTRYVYDACSDPVFVATVLHTIRSGGRQADLVLLRADGTEVDRGPSATAKGDGVSTVPHHDPSLFVSPTDESDRTTIAGRNFEITVMRRLDDAPPGPALTGGFEGGSDLRLIVVSG